MNKVILMGRLTKDPELTHTPTNNTALCKFTLAVDRRFVSPEAEKQADFIPIVCWNKTAEFCSKYFNKGQKVVVVGNIQTRSWDDNDGNRHYATEVVSDEVYFAEKKKEEKSKDYADDGVVGKKPKPAETEGIETDEEYGDGPDGLPF